MIRFLIINHISNAHQSLKSNRMRSALTMLGITIGVASITAIFALGGGASQVVGNQVDELGGNVAVVRPGAPSETPLEDLANFPSQQYFSASTLTETDIATVENLQHVEAVAPLMILPGAVRGSNDAPANTPIISTTPELEVTNDLQMKEGQFLSDRLIRDIAVIGPQLSIEIFGTEQSIGQTVTIRGLPFTIVGVLKRTNAPINYNGVDFDNAVMIGRDSGLSLTQGALQIQQINVRVDSVTNLDATITEANQTILRNHLGQADFSVLSGEQIAQPTNQLFMAIAGTTTAIAAISLIVGGIGVMNIMLVSVAERTREIGIRKALGASNGDIVGQFLIESLALSIGGGIAGYISGYALAFVISTFLTFSPVVTWEIAAVAFGVSLVIGTVFGLYPAIRAAKKDPINALRQYD